MDHSCANAEGDRMKNNVDLKKIGAWGELVNRIFFNPPQGVLADVVFVHGWGDLHDEMIELAAGVFRQSGAKYILLNGATEYEVSLPGFSYWKEWLTAKYGISAELILETKPASNTQIEAQELRAFLTEKNLSSAVILSVPQHITRAFLTDLGAINEAKPSISLYPRTLSNVDWGELITIHNLSGAKEHITRLGRMAAEFARIVEYRRRFEDGDKNFTIASVEEGLNHLEASQ